MELIQLVDIPITLEFILTIDSLEGIDSERLKKMLEYVIDTYNTCNHPPFCVEMLNRGLHECVESAIQKAIEEREQNKYQNETVKHKNGSVSKWVTASLRAYRKVKWWLSNTH